MTREEIVLTLARTQHAIVQNRVKKMGAQMRGAPQGSGPGNMTPNIPDWDALSLDMKKIAIEDATTLLNALEQNTIHMVSVEVEIETVD